MPKPKILIVNDDGYGAQGIESLAGAVRDLAEVCVCAPTSDRSGVSSALSLNRNLVIEQRAAYGWAVFGTPVDCIHFAVNHCGGMPWRRSEIDLTITGINHGSNMGEDTIYSGTFAAARESALFGIPAVAFSLDSIFTERWPPLNFAAASSVAHGLVERILADRAVPPNLLLNVNIPDLPIDQHRSLIVTELGHREPVRNLVAADRTPGQESYYYDGTYEMGLDNNREGTDFWAVARRHTSVTALQPLGSVDREMAVRIEPWLR